MNNSSYLTHDLINTNKASIGPIGTSNGTISTSIDPSWLEDTWIADPSILYPNTYSTTPWPNSYTTTTITLEDLKELGRNVEGTHENSRPRMRPSKDVSPILADILNDL